MNGINSQTMAGAVSLFSLASTHLLRALGLNIPESVDPALAQWILAGMGIYMVARGQKEALYTPVPTPPAVGTLPDVLAPEPSPAPVVSQTPESITAPEEAPHA
jgi:hypothetical protein